MNQITKWILNKLIRFDNLWNGKVERNPVWNRIEQDIKGKTVQLKLFIAPMALGARPLFQMEAYVKW